MKEGTQTTAIAIGVTVGLLAVLGVAMFLLSRRNKNWHAEGDREFLQWSWY